MKPSEVVEAHGASQDIVAIALVELGRRLAPERGLLQPVQGMQGPVDAPDHAPRQRQAVLTKVGAQPIQRRSRCDERAGPDGCRQTENVDPLDDDQGFVDPAVDEGGEHRPSRGW